MADENFRTTRGILESLTNAYEPSHSTLSSPYNTQATRDVCAGKSGLIGNAKAGDKVYDPNSKVRKAISKKMAARNKTFKKRL